MERVTIVELHILRREPTLDLNPQRKRCVVIAEEVMSADPITVRWNARVVDVLQLLQDAPFRHVPVVEEDDTLVGIVSDRDLRAFAITPTVDDEGLASIRARYDDPISSLMTPDPITVGPETNLSDVALLMVEHKIGAVPVTDPITGSLVGIVSYVDLLRATQDLLAD